MPKLGLNDGLEKMQNTTSHYGFSAVGLNKLTGTDEYTLVTIVVDKSSSVTDFNDLINGTVSNVVEACRKSPRADNLLLRVVEFNGEQFELHGFKNLMDCSVNDYNSVNMMKPSGVTALFDVALNAIESTISYGAALISQDYKANALVVIVTDGEDNSSRTTPKFIKQQLSEAKQKESVESIQSILVGVNVKNNTLKQYLDSFKADAGLDSFVSLDDAKPNTLAKLAQFISKSISSVSQSLRQGASQPLTF